MEINIFSWLEIKNKLYWKHLQTVDSFLSDWKLHIEWDVWWPEEIEEKDIITLEDYKHLSEFLLSDKVKNLVPRVIRDYPKDEYQALHELLWTPHYNVHVWVQINFMERKLLSIPEGFNHPSKPNALLLGMNQHDKNERLRRSMGKLNKSVGNSWWYQYDWGTGEVKMPSGKVEMSWTVTRLKTWAMKKKYGTTTPQEYNQQLKELFFNNGKWLPNLWLVDEPMAPNPDTKASTSYWVKVSSDVLSDSIKIADL